MNSMISQKTLLFLLPVFASVVAAKDYQNATNDQFRQLSANIFAHRDELNLNDSVGSSSSSLRGSISSSSPSSSEEEIPLHDESTKSAFKSTSIPCTIEMLFGLEPRHDISLKNYLTCATKDGQFFDVNLLHGLSSLYESLSPEEELIINVGEQEARQRSFQLIGHIDNLNYTRRRKEDKSTGISSRNVSPIKARNTSGRFKLLVVRVLGQGTGDIIKQSEAKLYDDFFGDSSNVRTRMMKCSNNKLIFDPATGDKVNKGVLTLRIDENLKGVDFLMVSTMATAEVRSRNLDYTHIAFVMPQTVDFRGRVAFGEQPGTVSWFQTDFASNAFIQVHEISHNLGFNHSWKGSDEFGDSTDSTGNIGQWADDGPVACFNGAKTYYSNWYSEYYSSLDPGMNPFSKELVGLNDIISKPSVSTKNNLVVRLSTAATDDLFIMYQRAEGILDTLQGNSRDTVTISQQKSFEAPSWSLAELRPGQEFRYENYGRYGRPLIVKFCSEIVDSNDIDKAHVITYVEGLTEASCGAYMDIPTDVESFDQMSCSDTPLDFIWKRQRRNCEWVAAKPASRCSSKVLSSMCPQTCMTCDTCVDGRRRFYMKNSQSREHSRACYWASSRNTEKRCKVFGIAETCRKTCGQCS